MGFKIGDKVKKILDFSDSTEVGYDETGIVMDISSSISQPILVSWSRKGVWWMAEQCLQLISSSETISEKKNTMSTISSLIKKIKRQEPEKTFVKVGFLDEDDNITLDGKDALINILWEENKTKLKELADKIAAELDNK